MPAKETTKILNSELNHLFEFTINSDQTCECYYNNNHIHGLVILKDAEVLVIEWRHTDSPSTIEYVKDNTSNVFVRNNSSIVPTDWIAEEYRALNPDLRDMNNLDIFIHYKDHGIKEKRPYKLNKNKLPPDFCAEIYRSLYPDLSLLSDSELRKHYIYNGLKEKRSYKRPFATDPDGMSTHSPIFLNHDCSLTGAPIFLYDFVTYLKNNSIVKNPIIIESYPNNIFNNYNIEKIYHNNDVFTLLKIIKKINPVFIYNNSLSLYFYHIDKFKDYWYKTYFHFHETLENINHKQLNYIKDQKIFVVADKIKKELETVGCLNVRTLPPFVPLEKILGIKIFAKTEHKKFAVNSRVTIGMSGSLSDRKNPNLFYKLAKTYPTYDFVWIGGSEPDWKYWIPESLDNLKHIPHANNPIPHFAKLDYFFLTSKNDPCPIVVLENLILNNRVITIKDNIFYQHEKSLLKQNLIEIDHNQEDQIIEAFGSLNLSKYTKDEVGANYIKQNFSEPRIIKHTGKKNNLLIFNFYKTYYNYNDSEIYYFINLINNFNINNGLSYRVFININIDNGSRKKLNKEKQEFFRKKYEKCFDGILNLENISLSPNMGWDMNGLLHYIDKLYNDNKEKENQKVAYLHNKSNISWRTELNKIFYLSENEIEPYDTIVSDRFFVECPPEDLNREIIKKYQFFGDLYKKQFKYVQGTIFITRLNNLKTLYDLNSELQSNLTSIDTKNNFWIESMKNDKIFNRYYEFYLDNEHNSPIDLDSKIIIEKGLANNYIDLFFNFGKKGIPDLHFEHCLERYIGYLISCNKKVLIV